MTIEEFVAKTTDFLRKNEAFFFLLDFNLKQPFICPLNQTQKENIYFEIEGLKNHTFPQENIKRFIFKHKPIDYQVYKKSFDIVYKNLLYGNTYLLNLTFPIPINTNLSLKQIFSNIKAKYKLLFKDDFVIFSPESFIKIKGNNIYTYPMKGTIDASIENAQEIIINDKKELYEHYTVVDLLRNDLAIMASNITVKRFRYTELINTHKGDIIQVSSEIQGTLPQNWRVFFAEKLIQMLPAGSISGAPKKKTLEIIRNVEIDKRGYYTGIFGIHLSGQIYSAVNIRFIEKQKQQFIFRSGGGITIFSKAEKEYQELIQKVYVPLSIR